MRGSVRGTLSNQRSYRDCPTFGLSTMKRDFDLIRDVLLYVEDSYGFIGNNQSAPLADASLYKAMSEKEYPNDSVSYNINLMIKAELLEAEYWKTGGNNCRAILGITWEGHEYLDSVRDAKIWKKIKEKLVVNSGSVSLTIVKKISEKLVLSAIGMA